MKYLVLSDSHGNVDNMVRAVELVKPHGIIHLGDGWRLSRFPATAISGALKRLSAC